MIIVFFFYRRQKCSTDLAYLKALRPLYQKVATVFAYQDPTFPKDVDGAPDQNVIGRINAAIAELKDAYKGTGKKITLDQFAKKVAVIPSVAVVPRLVEFATVRRGELAGELEQLEGMVGPEATIEISSRLVPGKRTNLKVKLDGLEIRKKDLVHI